MKTSTDINELAAALAKDHESERRLIEESAIEDVDLGQHRNLAGVTAERAYKLGWLDGVKDALHWIKKMDEDDDLDEFIRLNKDQPAAAPWILTEKMRRKNA